MKRAKFSLLVITVFTLAGGAYAFKASRASNFIYYRSATTTLCLVKANSYSLLPAIPGQLPYGNGFVTTIPGICNTTTSFFTAP